ncbi:MAG: OmpW family protein [Flavobacteriales bacterium]|nr:OmpW family protein [Flavobacteriia bacterium]NCP07006.1 OmpW family protein [Flavobacteriales bacterium]PIV95102.1 MAG: OmpW family protein [Flavobacteriaceae bacterium CG17_big_fil_post_rev_8_21_14_2_50_33_15]PIY09326.1 MAG: OmpW family protein [Flavobacteriaceae bacterium CG_4_10_14_3_um_filter_33_47]PJB20301.1 MAG: OmpW family protein [Flavobacteriaceae bacterium CG_4_9_14_3_um_filter_33_16]
MRKTIFTALMLCLTFGFVNAQESEPKSNQDFSKWQVRLRGLAVIPNESASIQAIGGDVQISTAYVPELDFTYFFTKNIAAELILATTNHDVKAVSTSAGDINLGDVWLLPPTLTLQYHFNGEVLRPYVGAGVNYTIFYNADEGPVADKVDYDNSLGIDFQLGFDYFLNDKWFINVDAKYLLLNTTATVNATTALGATVDADVDINPLILGVGFGMKF